jgi:RimJ/RimL family protein N-acetyltransferase
MIAASMNLRITRRLRRTYCTISIAAIYHRNLLPCHAGMCVRQPEPGEENRMSLQECERWNTAHQLDLYAGLAAHLAVRAVLEGCAAGRVWADDPQSPQTGVVWTAHRVFVAGRDVGALHAVVHEIAAAARARGDWGMGIYGAAGTDWRALLAGLTWREMAREYWAAEPAGDLADGRAGDFAAGDRRGEEQRGENPGGLPALQLRAVDAALLAEPDLGALEQLREEMCSERESVEDFLARSFGVCFVDAGRQTLAGWCLSEYSCGARCEVGIEVLEAYQRRGLGTRLTQALCGAAAQRGVNQVGWHCLAANEPSRATARRAGLQFVAPYRAPVVLLGEGG